jgi:hypothetical protein
LVELVSYTKESHNNYANLRLLTQESNLIIQFWNF